MKLNYFITLLVTTCFLSSLASADNSLTQRMKSRLPEVLALKNSGVVGEGTDGKLLVRKEEGEKLEKLVMEENHKTTTTSILSVMAADPVAFSEKLLPTYGYCKYSSSTLASTPSK